MPNGLEICGAPLWGSRPASQDKYRMKWPTLAGPVGREAPWKGSSELLGRLRACGGRESSWLIGYSGDPVDGVLDDWRVPPVLAGQHPKRNDQ